LSGAFLIVALIFVYRSFYGMRIPSKEPASVRNGVNASAD